MAVLHPWALQPRGAERTFFELARALPHADVFFLHYDRRVLPPDIEARVAGTSFLQREPWRRLPYRAMLPLLPTAVESLRLTRYDVVVSSSFGWTHGAITGDVAAHVSYMHSPPRYLWDEPPPSRGARALGPMLHPVLHQLRMWDRLAADRVDHFLANSRRTERRIAKRYARSAEVLHPPVDVARFRSVRGNPNGHLVAVGELVPYKRFELAVRAARAARVRLVVVGDGPERARLERLAEGADVHFVGRVSDLGLLAILEGARALIHPGVEDFGIAMVEALAAGLPVIGADAAGAREIVTHEVGALAWPLTTEAFVDALERLPTLDGRPDARRARAAEFSIERFQRGIVRTVAAQVGAASAAR